MGGPGVFPGRFVVLHDLDTPELLPFAVLFEQPDGTARLQVFEDAEARDPHLSKIRRDYESFETACASWSRSALISTYGRIGSSV